MVVVVKKPGRVRGVASETSDPPPVPRRPTTASPTISAATPAATTRSERWTPPLTARPVTTLAVDSVPASPTQASLEPESSAGWCSTMAHNLDRARGPGPHSAPDRTARTKPQNGGAERCDRAAMVEPAGFRARAPQPRVASSGVEGPVAARRVGANRQCGRAVDSSARRRSNRPGNSQAPGTAPPWRLWRVLGLPT